MLFLHKDLYENLHHTIKHGDPKNVQNVHKIIPKIIKNDDQNTALSPPTPPKGTKMEP